MLDLAFIPTVPYTAVRRKCTADTIVFSFGGNNRLRHSRHARVHMTNTASSYPKDELVFFATCPRGLGDVLSREISSSDVNGNVTATYSSGVEFTAESMATGYAACLWLRTAIRVLHLIAVSSDVFASDPESGTTGTNEYDDLYNFVRHSVDWNELLFGGRQTFSVQVRESSLAREHGPDPTPQRNRRTDRKTSQYASRETDGIFGAQRAQICIKDAICDAVRDAENIAPKRPDSHASADVPLFVAIHRGKVSLYRDLTGASLHKRGYRSNVPLHRSSLNEALAAGMLYLAGFQPDGSFIFDDDGMNEGRERTDSDSISRAPSQNPEENHYFSNISVLDPMCGSGTLLIEAALCRLHIAPGLYRTDFPFQRWHDYDQREYDRLVTLALSCQREDNNINMSLTGSDTSKSAVFLARKVLERIRISHLVEIKERDVRELQLEHAPTIVITNPPWGRRLHNEVDAWQDLGDFLKRSAEGSRAILLSGDRSLTRGLGMRARRKIPVRIGGVDCRVLVYDVLPRNPAV